jgi:hypothetical protein
MIGPLIIIVGIAVTGAEYIIKKKKAAAKPADVKPPVEEPKPPVVESDATPPAA